MQETIIGTYLIWEDVLVVQDVLSPIHQSVDVLWSWKLCRPLVLDTVFPQVLVPLDQLGMNGDHIVVSHRGPADIIGH